MTESEQKPNFTSNIRKAQLWALDEFTKSLVLRLCEENLIHFDYAPSVFQVETIQFRSSQDYDTIITLLKNYSGS